MGALDEDLTRGQTAHAGGFSGEQFGVPGFRFASRRHGASLLRQAGFQQFAFVGEQVEVALAVAEFNVLQTVELVRQGEKGFGQEAHGFHMDRELVCAGAEKIAGDADVVTKVEQLVDLEVVLAHGVLANVDLQALAVGQQRCEAGLALRAVRDDTARERDLDTARFQRFGRRIAVLADDGRQAPRRLDAEGIRVGGGERGKPAGLAEICDALQLFKPFGVQLFFKIGGKHVLSSIEGCDCRTVCRLKR